MPRRNYPRPRRLSWLGGQIAERQAETRPMTGEEMARSLVQRGLASPTILDRPRLITTQKENLA